MPEALDSDSISADSASDKRTVSVFMKTSVLQICHHCKTGLHGTRVADVAVIGTPHEKWGETPLALVVLRAETAVSAEALTEWANARLAKHRRIAGVEFRAELPRNALGKVLKKELREPYWSR